MELHAYFQLIHAFEHLATQYCNQFGAVFTVGIFGLHGYAQLFASAFAFEGLFQPGNYIAGTVQINHRRSTGGAIDDLAGIVGEGLVDGDGLVGSNQHGVEPLFR